MLLLTSMVINTSNGFQMPEIVRSPAPGTIIVQEGDPVTLNCSAVGNPEPVLHWVRLDSALQEKATEQEKSLFIPAFNASDSGMYVCVAINSVGMAVSNATTLTTNG